MSDLATEWEVIVIGGGPAGATVARYVAEGGRNVLVIDGRDPIGSPLQRALKILDTLPATPARELMSEVALVSKKRRI